MSFGAIQGRAHDQTGYNDAAFTDPVTPADSCTKYSPTTGTGSSATSSAWVGSSGEALVSHGGKNFPCGLTSLDTSTQSAASVKPSVATTAPDGTPFVLATMKHYNNPISSSFAAYYRGSISLLFSGFSTPNTVDFGYQLRETPNGDNPCASSPAGPNPNQPGQGVNANGCADWILFESQVSTTVLTAGDGTRFRLVLNGFSTSCSTYDPSVVSQTFWTKEQAITTACIWGSFQQIRTLKVVKKVVAPAGVTPPAQAFSFSSTSDLRGSAWDGTAWTLANGATKSGELLQSETVAVTEAQLGGKWTLTDISCRDGTNAVVTPVSTDLKTGRVTLKVGAPATVAAGPVTCTYENTYQPQATLTLVKQVTGGGSAATAWTLSAAGPTSISGITGTAAVTNQTVSTGTYTLGETGPVGYAASAWSCTGGTLTGSSLTLADNANVTCTITNRLKTGGLVIAKLVNGPPSGFPDPTKPFTGTYVCGTAAAAPFATRVGAPFTATGIPAGTSCTVTEAPPTGSTNLLNTSFTWVGAPSYDPAPSVTIPDQGSATVTITNTFQQNTGSLLLAKKVQARPGTDQTGYTGGAARPFPMAYTCTIGGTTTKSGSANVTPATPVTVTGIPATSSCAVTETLAFRTGDFADPSYAWDVGTNDGPKAIPVDGSATVTTTNFFKKQTGNLTLVKRVVGNGFNGGTAAVFSVAYDCGTASGTVSLANGGSSTVTVPANLGCSVTETPPTGNLATGYEWGPPTYEGLTAGVVTVPPNGTATVTVTNPTQPIYGQVSVTKLVTGETDGIIGGSTFPVRVVCTAPGGAGNYSNTFQLLPGTAQTTPKLQVGSSCTVTEQTRPALVDPSYAWGPVPAPQTVTITDKDQTVGVTLTNNVTRVYGSLAITKVVPPVDGITGSGVTFSGTWSCTYGASTIAGTWTRSGPGAATLTGGNAAQIPLTSICTVSENPPSTNPSPTDPSYNWGGTTITGPVTITAATPPTTVTVTDSIVRASGAFTVGKSVVGGAPGVAFENTVFTFFYSCQPRTGAAITGPLTARAGETAQLPAGTVIPVGSLCTVTETGRATETDPFRWQRIEYRVENGPPSSAGATFPVPASPTVQVLVTNVIAEVTVPVLVTKRVTGETQGYTGTTFTVALSCLSPPNSSARTYGPIDVPKDGTATFQVFLGSTSCSASETPPDPGQGLADASYGWGRTTYAPTNVAVTDPDGTYAITVSNPIVRVRAGLALDKVLVDPDAVVDPTRTYVGSWTCAHTGDTDVTGTWSVSGTGNATLTGVPAGGILLGSVCAPAESVLTTPPATNGDPSYSWAAPAYDPATVAADGTARMNVTNTVVRTTGDVQMTKTLTGQTLGYVGTGAAFAVDYRCTVPAPGTAAPLTGTANVAAGATAPLATGIPSGWTCSAAEQPPSSTLLRNASYSWGPSTVSTPVTVTTGGTATITVTNPILRNLGSLEVDKLFGANADAVADGATFSGTYACSYNPGQPDAATFSGTWTVTGEGTATLAPVAAALPVGTTCTVTETAPSGGLVDASWTWSPPVVSGPVIVASAQSTATATVTNTPQRVFGSLRVTKVFDGDAAAALKPGAQVTGVWTCDVAGGTRPEDHRFGPWTLPAAGGSAVVFAADGSVLDANGNPIRVPATAACTVVENTPGNDLLTDASYDWAPATYVPADGKVTVPVTGSAQVTVTNSVVRTFASFTVTKVAQAPADQTGTFEGDYTCRHTGDLPQVGRWSVTLPGTGTVTGILVGSTCSIVEDLPTSAPKANDISYEWAGSSIAPETAQVGSGPVGFTVTNVVRRNLTGLTVTKALVGDVAGAPVGLLFPVSYTCTDQSGGVHTGSDSIGVGGTFTSPEDIPVGSACEVSEGTLPDVTPRFTWGPPLLEVTNLTGETQSGQTVSFDMPPLGADGPVVPEVLVTNTILRQGSGYTLTKTADPPSGSTVQPGDTITYTVTVAPTGPGVIDDVVVTDDLSQVLPYAVVGNLTPSQGTAAVTGTDLTWTIGTLSGTTPLTITYTGTVNAGAYAVTLRNSVSATGELPPTPCPTCTTTTTHETPPAYDLTKTSAPPSGTTVTPGSVVTYSLTVTNASTDTPLTDVVVQDDLSDVLDDAAFTGVVAGTGGTLSGTTLTWTVPEVPASGTAVLSYAVTVHTDAFGTSLRNVATGIGPVPPTTCDPCGTEHPTGPGWVVTKTSDPATGAEVQPGQQVTYTLTARNLSAVSPFTGGVVTDDLSDVLDNATFDGVASGTGGSLAGTTLTWTVPPIPAGNSVTLTYAVTVGATAFGVELTNVATGGGPVPPVSCDPCSTDHFTPGAWTLAKTADPVSGTLVEPGQTVTYTLTATNLSTASPLTGALATDDLADVLDNATFGGIVSGTGGSLSGTTLSWTVPEIPAGGTVTLSYAVTVKPAAYGVTLRNVVTGGGPIPPVACDPCTTEHPTSSAWTLAKTADPASGSQVKPGQRVTYTLTVGNVSAKALTDVVVTDDLADVLNHATFVGVTAGAGATLQGTTLTWTVPEVPAGERATLSYAVTVKADAWNITLRNAATGTGPVPPTCTPATVTTDIAADTRVSAAAAEATCVVTTTHQTPRQPVTPPVPPPPEPGFPLPHTGIAGLAEMISVGTALVLLGFVLVGAVRRRREPAE